MIQMEPKGNMGFYFGLTLPPMASWWNWVPVKFSLYIPCKLGFGYLVLATHVGNLKEIYHFGS